MAIAPNTRTIMDSPDLGQGQTRTGLSTQIVVMVGDRPVGAIQSFAQTQMELNEDAYNEIRLQMHNHLITKLRSLKEDWELDNISQVTERIMLVFF